MKIYLPLIFTLCLINYFTSSLQAFEYLPCEKGGVAAWRESHQLHLSRESLDPGSSAGEAVAKGFELWSSLLELSIPLKTTEQNLKGDPARWANGVSESLLSDLTAWRLAKVSWIKWEQSLKDCNLTEVDLVYSHQLSLDNLQLQAQQSFGHALGLEVSTRPSLTNLLIAMNRPLPDDLQGLRFLYPPETAVTQLVLTPWTYTFADTGFYPTIYPNLLKACAQDSISFSFNVANLGALTQKFELQLATTQNDQFPTDSSQLSIHPGEIPSESWMALEAKLQVPNFSETQGNHSFWRIWGKLVVKSESSDKSQFPPVLLGMIAPEKGQCPSGSIALPELRDFQQWVDPLTLQELAEMSSEQLALWRPVPKGHRPFDPSELFEKADLVVLGKIQSVEVKEFSGVLWSQVVMDVKETFKGTTLKQLVFWQPGGEMGPRGEAVLEMPALAKGEQIVGLFSTQEGPHPWAIGRQGVFFLRPGKTARVVNGWGHSLTPFGPRLGFSGLESMSCQSCRPPQSSSSIQIGVKLQQTKTATHQDFLQLLRRFKKQDLANLKKSAGKLELGNPQAFSFMSAFSEKKSLPRAK